MELQLAGAFLRFYSGSNWSHLELGFATRRHGGLARRESAIQVGFRSDHALELLSVENPADRFIAPDGSITYGRIYTRGRHRYSLSAEQVYSAQLFDRAAQRARLTAEAELQQTLADAAAPAVDLGQADGPSAGLAAA